MANLIRNILGVVKDASIHAEVLADGRCFIVREQNGKRQVVPATSRMAECLIIAAVSDSDCDLPSRIDVKLIIDILIGRAMAGIENMVEEYPLRVPKVVDLVLKFMEDRAKWSGRTRDLLEGARKLASKSAGLINLPESTRVFSEEIQKHEVMFNERGLAVKVSHKRNGSTTQIARIDAGETNADAAAALANDSPSGDASDASDAGDKRFDESDELTQFIDPACISSNGERD